MIYLNADLVFFRGSSPVSRAIRWATRGRGEAATWTNHVGGICMVDVVPLLLEARAKVTGKPFTEYDPATYQVWRHTKLSKEQRAAISEEALKYAGRRYGYLKIVTHLGDALLAKAFGGNPFFFRRVNHIQNYPVCDWIWSYSYKKGAGYTFGTDPAATTPDLMLDWVQESPHWVRLA